MIKVFLDLEKTDDTSTDAAAGKVKVFADAAGELNVRDELGGQKRVLTDADDLSSTYEPAFTKNTAFNKDFEGSGTNDTVARSDHSHSAGGGEITGYMAEADYAAAGSQQTNKAADRAIALNDDTNSVTAAQARTHIDSTANPHSVDKTDVGLANVPNVDTTDAANISSGTLDGDRLPALSATKKGGVPATGTPSGLFLKDDGTWGTPTGAGDMAKAIYDSDDNGIVDGAEELNDGLNSVTAAAARGHIDSAANPHSVTKAQVGLTNVENTLHNFSAAAAPTADDDTGDGYTAGSIWVDTASDISYMCVDNTAGAAVWKIITSADILAAERTLVDLGVLGASWTLDMQGGVFQEGTVSNAVTVQTPSNAEAGKVYTVNLYLTATGTYNIVFPAAWGWVTRPPAETITVNSGEELQLIVQSVGATNIRASYKIMDI